MKLMTLEIKPQDANTGIKASDNGELKEVAG